MDAIEQKERELAKITRYKQAIYQDWKDGEISHSDYRHMKEDYERQAEALDEVIGKLRAEQAELENGIDTENTRAAISALYSALLTSSAVFKNLSRSIPITRRFEKKPHFYR